MSERYLTVRDARPRRSGAWTGSPRAVAAKPVMLLVLGMHRSGTSICARGLECLGATASRKLMPPGEDNPKGFFEDAEIFALNEEQLLPRLNRVWNSVAPVDWSCLSDTDRSSAALEAARILRRNFAAAAPLCVLKEPRIGALLPFWLSVLSHCGYEVRVVFAVRDPASVARSLAKRNGMTTAHSSMLFVSYWMSILGCVSGLPAAFVQFDELLTDPRRTLEKAALKLGLSLPADFERRVGIFATEFLEEGLRHHQFDIKDLDLDPEVPPLALELYRQLLKAAQAQSLEPLRRFAATKNKELGSIQPFLLDFDKSLLRQRTLEAESSRLGEELGQLQAIVQERTNWGQELDKHIKELSGNLDREQKLVEERTAWAQKLQAELDQARHALAGATKDAEEKSQWAKSLDREIGQLRAVAEERTAWAQKLDSEVEGLRAAAEERTRLDQTLAETRQAREQAAKHAEDMERKGAALESELGQLRVALADQKRIAAERTAWAQKLDSEVEGLRAAAEERTRLDRTLAETRQAREQAAKHAEDMERKGAALETELGRLRDALADQKRIAAERTAWAQKLDREVQDLRAVAEERTAWAQAQDREVEQLRAALAEADERNRQSSGQGEALREKLFAIESSTVWKLLAPVRAVGTARNALGSALATTKEGPTPEQPDYFDPLWYLSTYPDAACKPSVAFRHFAEIGAAQGKLPNRRFRPEAYEALAQDVAAAGVTPSLHYLLHGEKEGRCTNWLDRYINDEFGEAARRKTGSLIDLLLAGEGLSSSPAYRKEKLRRLVQRFEKAMSASKPSQGKPVASIVIPVYNQLFYTLACAISLFESAPQASFEIIVADDCSTDKTAKVFAKYSPAVKVVRPRTNLGFLRNCNHAARHAQGEIIIMLNNDTIALPGWLDGLVETLQARSDCGMAGSKLLDLDGTLQEAGAIYWNDGSAWNFGRGKDPRSYEFAYCKEVDYASGASIALRRDIWEKAGGFDEHFAPAYCEEVDLAFRLREHLGLATIYQPQSVLVHHEGVSHGRDVAVGIKAYQQRNQKKFLERWKSVLERDHFANGQSIFLARDRSRRKPHMLFVDHYVPTPDRDAGSKQMDAYLKLFVRLGIHVTFWPDNLAFDPANTARYQAMGIEVVDTKAGHISFSDWIKDHGRFIDVAFLSRPHISVNYLDALESFAPGCRRVYYGHDLHAERLRRELQIAETVEARDELPKMEAWEETCWSKVDFICYPSQEECDHVAAKHPGRKTGVLPLYCVTAADALAARTRRPFGERNGLLFVGGFNHRPNADGVLWFARNVLPLILKESPSVRLTIAGSNPPEEVRDLASIHPGLTITGHVSDEELNNLYEQARVSIAPLRFGAGVKGKVVDSLMRGVPVVTTPVGIQGLAGIGAAISFSDDPARFAALVIELHRNQALWEKQREAGFTYFDDHFTEHAVLQHVRKWLPETAETTSPA